MNLLNAFGVFGLRLLSKNLPKAQKIAGYQKSKKDRSSGEMWKKLKANRFGAKANSHEFEGKKRPYWGKRDKFNQSATDEPRPEKGCESSTADGVGLPSYRSETRQTKL